MILADIAEYVTDKISSNDVSLNNYVTTDSLLQNNHRTVSKMKRKSNKI